MLGFRKNYNQGSQGYKGLATKVFSICEGYMNAVGSRLSVITQAPRYSAEVTQMATSFGTALYEYSVMLARDKLRAKYKPGYEFESEDNKMIEAFAEVLMMPPTAMLKIVSAADKHEWYNRITSTDELIAVEPYIVRIENTLNEALEG